MRPVQWHKCFVWLSESMTERWLMRCKLRNQQYDSLMDEIENIVQAVKKFPDHAQDAACARIIDTFLRGAAGATSESQPNGAAAVGSETHKSVGADGDVPHDLDWYADNYDLESCSDMEFSAFVACYYCDKAVGDEKVEAIDKGHLKTAFEIVGRDVPANPNQTLIDSKRRKYTCDLKAQGNTCLRAKAGSMSAKRC